jgi:hypothetical protein
LDQNDDGVVQTDGSDDLPFSFTGTSGTNGGVINGIIHAVDFGSIVPFNILQSFGIVDFATQDVLFFSVELLSPSAEMDAIGVAVGSNPLFGNPQGGGTLTAPGVQPTSGVAGPFTTLRMDFTFAPLTAGQTTAILFATYFPGGALDNDDIGNFMVSSGTDQNFFSAIAVPEPSTALLLLIGGIGVAGLYRRNRRG